MLNNSNDIDTSQLKEEYSELYVKAETVSEAAERLEKIVSILRYKCPWDKKQTHQSLRPCLIEEAYELADAIDKLDFHNMREELGDLALHVVFHSILASENDHFNLCDVLNEECEKMIRRHPHVFSDEKIKTVDKVVEKWENIKSKEHGNNTHTERLIDVPDALPALLKSAKVQKRAADVGFDWNDIEMPIQKVKEELGEFIEAYEQRDKPAMIEELGDLLFSVVNVSRFAGINAEEALEQAADKFVKRFHKMEQVANEGGLDLEEMELEDMDAIWEKIK